MNKPLLALLAASILANGVLLTRTLLPPESGVATTPPRSVGATDPQRSATAPAVPGAGLSAAETSSLRHAQQLLATNDLPELVARLRAAGFSAMDIRGIVSARLAERYGSARVAATAHLEIVPYYRGTMSFPRNAESGAEVRRLFREQNQMFKDLLGPDARATDKWSQMLHDRQYDFLPPEKVERLTGILDDYRDLQQSVYEGTRGMFTPADQEKLALIEQEKRADLAALLTPEELEAYEMRTGPIASQLRRMMASFQPTEAEYKAIYRLISANTNNGSNPVRLNQSLFTSGPTQKPPTDLSNQLSTVLTPDRVADFNMMTSGEYLQLSNLAQRFDLPAAAVKDTYTLSQSTLKQASAIASDQSLSDSDRTTQLNALAETASAQAEKLLGHEAYQTYLTQGGRWIRNIQRRAAAPQPNRGPLATPAMQLP